MRAVWKKITVYTLQKNTGVDVVSRDMPTVNKTEIVKGNQIAS
jgi:hypothetical protein